MSQFLQVWITFGSCSNSCGEDEDKKKCWSIHNELLFAIFFPSAMVYLCKTPNPNFQSSWPCLVLAEKLCFAVAEVWSRIIFSILNTYRISCQAFRLSFSRAQQMLMPCLRYASYMTNRQSDNTHG